MIPGLPSTRPVGLVCRKGVEESQVDNLDVPFDTPILREGETLRKTSVPVSVDVTLPPRERERRRTS